MKSSNHSWLLRFFILIILDRRIKYTRELPSLIQVLSFFYLLFICQGRDQLSGAGQRGIRRHQGPQRPPQPRQGTDSVTARLVIPYFYSVYMYTEKMAGNYETVGVFIID